MKKFICAGLLCVSAMFISCEKEGEKAIINDLVLKQSEEGPQNGYGLAVNIGGNYTYLIPGGIQELKHDDSQMFVKAGTAPEVKCYKVTFTEMQSQLMDIKEADYKDGVSKCSDCESVEIPN